jgi:tRNA(His) 5'-end guanylyltransferase
VGHGRLREASKRFFFEKKNQKTFTTLGLRSTRHLVAKTDKSFLLLFFKKEALSFFYPSTSFPSSTSFFAASLGDNLPKATRSAVGRIT